VNIFSYRELGEGFGLLTPTATDRNSIVKWGASFSRRDAGLLRHGANSIQI